jgi:hypothetical protein
MQTSPEVLQMSPATAAVSPQYHPICVCVMSADKVCGRSDVQMKIGESQQSYQHRNATLTALHKSLCDCD